MTENQNTAPTVKGLAVSKRNPTFIAMPENSAHNRVQLLSNQRTNRGLSRVSVEPAVTPIWKQPTFTPSPDIQKRFGHQGPAEEQTVTIQPDAPPKPITPAPKTPEQPVQTQQPTATVPAPQSQSTPPTQSVPAQPVAAPQQTPQTVPTQPSSAAQPSSEAEKSTESVQTQPVPPQPKPVKQPTGTSPASSSTETPVESPPTQQLSEVPDLVQVVEDTPEVKPETEEKSISDLLDELSSSVKKYEPTQEASTEQQETPATQIDQSKMSEDETPLVEKNTDAESTPQTMQTSQTDKQKTQEPTQAEPDSSSTETLANSLNVLSELRQQIREQEEKLQSMRSKLPQIKRKEGEYLTDQKTKGALLKNVEHALLNSKKELEKLRGEPGANPETIKEIETQLQRQQETFNKLEIEQKQLERKAHEVQEKIQEHEEAEKTLDQLEQQHTELKSLQDMDTDSTESVEETPVSTELDPAIRQLINQSMATGKPEVPNQTSQPTAQNQSTQPTPPPNVSIKMPTITNEVNAINGIVTDTNNKLLTDAIVIVKNSEGRPLRALKTNKLGQFWITTALDDGKYSLETEKEGLSFDTIEVELTGNPVEPVLIAASS